MSTIINLLPHDVNLINGKVYPRYTGVVPRVKVEYVSTNITADDNELFMATFDKVENLPEPKEDTYLIVSRIIKDRCPNRKDLLVPGPQIRNEEGVIIGCKFLTNN